MNHPVAYKTHPCVHLNAQDNNHINGPLNTSQGLSQERNPVVHKLIFRLEFLMTALSARNQY